MTPGKGRARACARPVTLGGRARTLRYTRAAMTKNLVIVESPAKARTIERYLGADYKVLASYGHVRDLPENPGKGKFGVDVDHDFAPEYVISRGPQASTSPTSRSAAKKADTVYLATDLDREGEAIAWHVAEAANVPASEDPARDLQRDHRGRHPRGVRAPARHRHATSSTPSRRGASSTGWSATRSARCSGARSAAASPRVASSRSPCASSSTASAEIRAFTAREYWTLEAVLADPATARPFAAEVNRIDGKPVGGRRRRDGRERTPTRLRDADAAVSKVATADHEAQPGAAVHDRTLQQEASRKLGFNPQRTMRVGAAALRGRRDAATATSASSPTCGPTRPRWPAVAMREARDVVRRALRRARTRCPRAASTRRRRRAPRRPTRRSGRRSFLRDPESLARLPRSRRAPALPADLAARARVADGREGDSRRPRSSSWPGRYGLRATATPDVFDGFARVYTEGRDDDAAEPRSRSASCRRSPRAT